MKSEPMWPLIEKAHTYASENADIYHAYDDGQKAMLKRCIAAFNDWLKEQKPIVLPERKDSIILIVSMETVLNVWGQKNGTLV